MNYICETKPLNMSNVIAYGGGDNTVGMIVECVKRNISIEAIVFSDTGSEKPNTYAYIPYFNSWLAHQGYPQIETVKYNTEGLYNECIRRGTLPAIAFGFKSCSDKWKQRPFLRWIKAQVKTKEFDAQSKKDKKVEKPWVKFIGYDIDEEHRLKLYENKYWVDKYPLVEWGMDREDCVNSIRSVGLNPPGKSACFFCPSMRPHEIRSLKSTYPHLYESAIFMEKNAAPNLDTVKGLARNKSWEDIAQQLLLDFPTVEISCGCKT